MRAFLSQQNNASLEQAHHLQSGKELVSIIAELARNPYFLWLCKLSTGADVVKHIEPVIHWQIFSHIIVVDCKVLPASIPKSNPGLG